MSPNIHKFVELKSLKVSDKGSGTIEGYRAVRSIDEGGDLIVAGAFADTIDEYLSSGFSAESHDWSFSNMVGFPVEAKETDRGLWVKSQFHSTPDAQNIRQKAKERMEAGKSVGFSFGYKADEYDFIDAKDYQHELPRYVNSGELGYNLAQAKKFPRIRLLKKLTIYEDSLVTAPMNRQATATGVKGYRNTAGASDLNKYRLRSRSLDLQLRAWEALYGPFSPQKSLTQLRYEGAQVCREAERILSGIRF